MASPNRASGATGRFKAWSPTPRRPTTRNTPRNGAKKTRTCSRSAAAPGTIPRQRDAANHLRRVDAAAARSGFASDPASVRRTRSRRWQRERCACGAEISQRHRRLRRVARIDGRLQPLTPSPSPTRGEGSIASTLSGPPRLRGSPAHESPLPRNDDADALGQLWRDASRLRQSAFSAGRGAVFWLSVALVSAAVPRSRNLRCPARARPAKQGDHAGRFSVRRIADAPGSAPLEAARGRAGISGSRALSPARAGARTFRGFHSSRVHRPALPRMWQGAMMTPWHTSPFTGLFTDFGPILSRPHDPACALSSGVVASWLAQHETATGSGIGWDNAAAEGACVGEAIERLQCSPLPDDGTTIARHDRW